jgi:hypothetical protein
MKTANHDWKTWLKHGDQFFKGSTPKSGKVSILGPVIRYNMMSMALESYVMGILNCYSTMPDNHTFTDLVNALDQVIKLDPVLKQQILKHENIQSICSVDKYQRRAPGEDELAELYAAITEIKDIAHSVCNKSLV